MQGERVVLERRNISLGGGGGGAVLEANVLISLSMVLLSATQTLHDFSFGGSRATGQRGRVRWFPSEQRAVEGRMTSDGPSLGQLQKGEYLAKKSQSVGPSPIPSHFRGDGVDGFGVRLVCRRAI